MQHFIALIMRGRVEATLAIALTALLSLMVTPIAVISMAIVVLATLRNGLQEGVIVVVWATVLLSVITGIVFQAPVAFALFGISLFIPAWGIANVLGSSGSLARALGVVAIGSFFIVGLQYAVLEEPSTFWYSVFQEFIQNQLDPTAISLEEQSQLLQQFAQWMPGAVAAGWFITVTLALFLGRWAALRLDNTANDSFGAEFRALRFGHLWLITIPALLLSAMLSGSYIGLAGQLATVGMMLFLLQGISIVHAVAKHQLTSGFWLVGFYFVLFFGAPYSTILIAVLGYVDGWLDFRPKEANTNPDQ